MKGGDPGIFGRMAEEIGFLVENNIPFEVVPGVSSVNGAPVCSGIPLTHHKNAFGFVVVSGKDAGRIREVPLKGTIVVLMGGCTAKEVATNLIRSGLEENREVAVIEKGSMKGQRVTVTTLRNLVTKEYEFESPALIVVGDVVKLANLYLKENRKI